jgi:hypothetical protein
MADEIQHGDGRMENPSVRHERTDASFRAVLLITLGAMVFAAVVHYVLLMFFFHERSEQAAIKKSNFPLAPSPSTALPREPRLEQVERLSGDAAKVNVYERQVPRLETLNDYGATPEEGFIHVPIDRAIELLAGKLPHREESSADQKQRSSGLVDAGESNSGRLFRGRPK